MKKRSKTLKVESLVYIFVFLLLGVELSAIAGLFISIKSGYPFDEMPVYLVCSFFVLVFFIVCIVSLDSFLQKRGKNKLFKVPSNIYGPLKVLLAIVVTISVPIVLFLISYEDFINFRRGSNTIYRYGLGEQLVRESTEIDSLNTVKKYKKLKSSIFIRYELNNNSIVNQAVCFIKNKRLVCLDGNLDSNYNSNYISLMKAFGDNNCTDSNKVICSDDDLVATMDKNGSVYVSDKNKTCRITGEGSICHNK